MLKHILFFFIKKINPRSLRLWCVEGTEESISRVDFLVPLMHHDPRDLGLICLSNASAKTERENNRPRHREPL